jgi:hypothetical protein
MYIRHLIETRHGRKIVDLKQVLYRNCGMCKKEVPYIFFGHDPKSLCAVEAIYKYTVDDIIEETSTLPNSMLDTVCDELDCMEKIEPQ